MKSIFTLIFTVLLLASSKILAQGSSPCSPYTLSVGSSYSPSTYSLMGVLINFLPIPTCDRGIMSNSGNLEPGLWFKFVVPSSGLVSLKTESVSIANSDIGLAIYRTTGGSCPSTLNLGQVTCLVNGNGYMPAQDNINLSSYIGQTLYIRVWKYGSSYSYGNFRIGLWSSCTTVNTPIISGNTTSCSGSVTLSINNPQSGVTYQWSHNGSTGTSTTVTSSTSTTVRATNSCGNVATSQSVNVTIASAPNVPTIDGNTTSCDGAVALQVANPQDGVTYTWSNGTVGSTCNYGTSTSVWVRATNNCGSVISQTVSITVLPPLSTPSISGTLSACNTTTLRVTNPQNGVTYEWQNGQTGTTMPVTESGSYTVTAQRDGCNPVTSSPADVTINKAPEVPIIHGETNPVCPNDPLQISIDNPLGDCQYTWSNGATGQNITATATSNLNLTVTARNACGQATSQAYRPTLIAKPAIPTIIGNNRICPTGGQTVLSIGNYDPTLNYSWSPSEQGSSIIVSQTGTYMVSALHPTCNFGSLNSIAFTVSVYPTNKPLIYVSPYNSNVLTVSNATSFQNFQWYKDGQQIGNSTSTYTLTGSGGNVYVEATDANGCVEKSVSQFVVATKELGQDDKAVKIYPNPTKGDFKVELNLSKPSVVELRVLNILGQVIYELSPKTMNTHEIINIPFEDKIEGEYLVWISIEGKTATRKLLVIN